MYIVPSVTQKGTHSVLAPVFVQLSHCRKKEHVKKNHPIAVCPLVEPECTHASVNKLERLRALQEKRWHSCHSNGNSENTRCHGGLGFSLQ